MTLKVATSVCSFLEKPLHEVYFIQVKEQVGKKRNTVGTQSIYCTCGLRHRIPVIVTWEYMAKYFKLFYSETFEPFESNFVC